MTDQPFDTPAFDTAARRRGGKVLKFRINHAVLDENADELREISHALRVDPALDLVKFGTLFRDFTQAMAGLNKDDQAAVMETFTRVMPSARKALRECIVPHDRAKYDEVSDGIDVQIMGKVTSMITNELSGLDPTQPRSSSDGQAETGSPSTDTPSPEA